MSEDISPLPVHVPPAARSRWLAQGYEYHECQALQTPLFAARDGGRREPSSDMKGSMTRSHQTKLPAVSWPQRPLPAHRASQSYRKTGSSEYENMEGPKESTPSSSLRQKNACEDHIDPPQQAQANSKDPEKTSGEYSDGRHHGYDRQSSALHSTVPYEGDDQDFEDGAEKHSIWILVSKYRKSFLDILLNDNTGLPLPTRAMSRPPFLHLHHHSIHRHSAMYPILPLLQRLPTLPQPAPLLPLLSARLPARSDILGEKRL